MEYLIDCYGEEYVEIADAHPGTVFYAFRYELADAKVVTVCTVGSVQEFACTVFEADMDAAAALLKVVLGRTDGPWVPGRVWLNQVPLLVGTQIQALVVDESPWAQVYPLTEPEAHIVARETMSTLTITEGRDPLALCDLFRENCLADITDEELANISVITAKMARTAPLRRLEYTSYGRFVALTEEEPAGYIDDPENFEMRPASKLIPSLHGARLFFHDPAPGEVLRYGEQGWEYSVT